MEMIRKPVPLPPLRADGTRPAVLFDDNHLLVIVAEGLDPG